MRTLCPSGALPSLLNHRTAPRVSLECRRPVHVATEQVQLRLYGAILVLGHDRAVSAISISSYHTIREFTHNLSRSVHYQERSSAAGKTPGGYIKRDGRPSDEEVLVSRIIDRTLRPLFPAGFCREVQILSWVLSYDPSVNTDPLSLVASSAALLASPIPFQQPISGVCVGMDPVTNEFVVNPSRKFLETSRLNLFVSGTADSVMMIEGAADFLTEEEMASAIEVGMEVIKMQCKGLKLFADATLASRNVVPKLHLVRKPDETLYTKMYEMFGGEMDKAIRTGSVKKSEVRPLARSWATRLSRSVGRAFATACAGIRLCRDDWLLG